MQINKINNYPTSLSFSSNKEEKETSYEKAKKNDPYFLTHALPATSTVALISIGHFILSEITLRQPSFIGIPFVAGLGGTAYALDSFVGKKLKENYKNNEEKRKKIQLLYNIGISTGIAPIAFSIMDKFKKPTNLMIKIAKDNKTDAYKSWINKKSLIGTALIGTLLGTLTTFTSPIINNWEAKNIYKVKTPSDNI